ncbi:hypothetical protein E4U24_008380 [Claviceps purpurea]|nr:hypothetical protein E4U24_008380 [Claviceps purpurea]KAG6260373.1 hypothetical protein E4U48_008388 [Claviceps purpurea]KAG6271219.1 hypothetical protein E4U47_003134 [Claviceps purpurea]
MAARCPSSSCQPPATIDTDSIPHSRCRRSLKTRPVSRRRWIPPRIALSLAVLAFVASFGGYATAERHAPAAAHLLARPASYNSEEAYPSSGLDDAVEAVVVERAAASVPVMQEEEEVVNVRTRRRVRRGGAAATANANADEDAKGGAEVEVLATASMKGLSERASGTTNGDDSSSPLPSPFDNLVPSAFKVPGGSSSCPKFMAGLLSDPTFKRCYPISMLMQTSTGFFNAQKQLVSIVKVLDATCAPDVTKCTDFLNQAAQNLTLDANCKSEFDQNQTQILQAYRGLRAYNVLYSAACLQNPTTNSYCFANAVTNLSTPSNTYLYFMPYGMSLPGASKPSCNWCTQTTMAIYHSASADRDQPVASKYEDAASQVNTLCGPSFVNASLPVAESAGVLRARAPSEVGAMMSALFALVVGGIFL